MPGILPDHKFSTINVSVDGITNKKLDGRKYE